MVMLKKVPCPATEFVVIGSGASKATEDKPREAGIIIVSELNVLPEKSIDAGESAFYLCMGMF